MPSNEGYGGQRMVPADSLIAANSNYSTIFKLIEAVKMQSLLPQRLHNHR